MVWVILLFYLVAGLWTLLGFGLIYSGRVPINPAQKAFLARLTVFDQLTTAFLGSVNIAAAVLLFRLRKAAVVLFCVVLALNLVLTTHAMAESNRFEALSRGGSLGMVLGLSITIAVVAYAIRLQRLQILY